MFHGVLAGSKKIVVTGLYVTFRHPGGELDDDDATELASVQCTLSCMIPIPLIIEFYRETFALILISLPISHHIY